MSQPLRGVLAQAVNTGEVIRIVYHGGSQPGTVREIGPIKVSETEVVAEELASGVVKTFKLERIEIPDSSAHVVAYDPALSPPVDTRCIKDVCDSTRQDLEAMGWHVEASETSIALHSFFKNGKLRKTPDVQLNYDEYIVDLVVDFDSPELKEERRKSVRPYHVYSRRLTTAKSFGKISAAAASFLDEAKGLAPARRPR